MNPSQSTPPRRGMDPALARLNSHPQAEDGAVRNRGAHPIQIKPALGGDPRREPGYAAEHFPRCDGGVLPTRINPDSCDRIRLEFGAAYYQLNQRWAALRLLRARESEAQPGGGAAERSLLLQIESGLRARDALEDHYAPLGIHAEPIHCDGAVVDLRFTFAAEHRRGWPHVSSAYVSSWAFLRVPLPPGVLPGHVADGSWWRSP